MRRLCVIVIALAASASAAEVSFVETTLRVEGELLDWELADIDGDGLDDLVLAVRGNRTDGKRDRTLQIHRMTASGPDATPVVVPILSDVIAWAAADVRDEPGRELVFITKGGAFSYSPTIDRYRGNIRRLARFSSLFDIAAQDELPRWKYVLDVGSARESLLFAERGGFSLWTPRTGGAPEGEEATDYARRASFGDTADDGSATFIAPSKNDQVAFRSGEATVRFSTSLDSIFLDESVGLFSSLITTDNEYRSPALADVDGDGRRDVIMRDEDTVTIYRTGSTGPSASPTRVEELPDYLQDVDELDLTLDDIDGDGDIDVVARRTKEEAEMFETATTDFLLLLNDGKRLFPDKPDQVLRFEASRVFGTFDDVDGNGRPDFIVGKVVLPSVTELVTGGKLTRSGYIYFDDESNIVTRKPAISDESSFDIEQLTDAIVQRSISHDMDGDGKADLVEIDLLGRVAVRRLVFETHFFGPDTWSLESSPWKLFEVPGVLGTISVQDINGDGLGDILGSAGDRLVIQLSRRGDRR